MTTTEEFSSGLSFAGPRGWRLDRRVPLALLLAVLVQTAVVGVWFGRTEARLDALEQFQRDLRSTDARLAVIEARLDAMHQVLGDIDRQMRKGT